MLSAAATHNTTSLLLPKGRPERRWSSSAWEEHELKALEHALDIYGQDWEKVAIFVGTKAPQQVFAYAQQFLMENNIPLGKLRPVRPGSSMSDDGVRQSQKRRDVHMPHSRPPSKVTRKTASTDNDGASSSSGGSIYAAAQQDDAPDPPGNDAGPGPLPHSKSEPLPQTRSDLRQHLLPTSLPMNYPGGQNPRMNLASSGKLVRSCQEEEDAGRRATMMGRQAPHAGAATDAQPQDGFSGMLDSHQCLPPTTTAQAASTTPTSSSFGLAPPPGAPRKSLPPSFSDPPPSLLPEYGMTSPPLSTTTGALSDDLSYGHTHAMSASIGGSSFGWTSGSISTGNLPENGVAAGSYARSNESTASGSFQMLQGGPLSCLSELRGTSRYVSEMRGAPGCLVDMRGAPASMADTRGASGYMPSMLADSLVDGLGQLDWCHHLV